MKKLIKFDVIPGVAWVEVAEADLRILCGCPADIVKHLMQQGLISPVEKDGAICESGPNVILLSDYQMKNGAFCNLSEFPVLQMLYRQGMVLPGHPGNTGIKPLLIGKKEAVCSQMAYIHRGNYGLVSDEEMIAAGMSAEQARQMMRMKVFFAFGKIMEPQELVNGLSIDDDQLTEIRNGVTIRRISDDIFEFKYGKEKIVVDINLPLNKVYAAPYTLDPILFDRENFAVLHCGEGDGWDPINPVMGSIVVYHGRIYLIDAGPNISYTLDSLGISINEVEGIFHTHSHDDHFAGLPTIIKADHRVKYFATPAVRLAVTKKMSALLGIPGLVFSDYFDVIDLEEGCWNDIDGLGVKPVISPHPVETTMLFFRAMAKSGWVRYAHLADIVSLSKLKEMVTDDPNLPGVDVSFYESIVEIYREPVELKKIDIGGGLIHGDFHDFIGDKSGRILFAHTADGLTDEQKKIGSRAIFGSLDVLVPGYDDFLSKTASDFLMTYFPDLSSEEVDILVKEGPIEIFQPGEFLLREGKGNQFIYLILTGQVVVTSTFRRISSFGGQNAGMLSPGAIFGLRPCLEKKILTASCRAIGYVRALGISCDFFSNFVLKHNQYNNLIKISDGRNFLWRLMSKKKINLVKIAMSNLGKSSSIAASTPKKRSRFLAIVIGILSIALLLANSSPASAVTHTKEKTSSKQAASDRKENSKKDKQTAGKVTGNYLVIAPVAVALRSDGLQKLRIFEIEAWVQPKSPLDAAMVRSAKKKIPDTLVKDFSSINWEMFTNPRLGPELAKRVIANSVNRVSGATVADVFIKSFILR